MNKDKLFGIDLGTTNSAISVYIGDTKSNICNIEDNGKMYTTLPSCVMWKGGDNWIVGREAYENRYLSNVCYSIKSHIGTDYIHTFEYGNKTIKKTPTEISAIILKALCDKAAEFGYVDIKKVTITVPAEFSSKEREETRKAGEMAGLEVLNIINEPTAAALKYNITSIDKSKEVLIYDLGGGTFDLTHIKITPPIDLEGMNLNFGILGVDLSKDIMESTSSPKFEVIASGGNRKLGGDDIDEAILKYALEDYQKLIFGDKNKKLKLTKKCFEQLKLVAANAKISLSEHLGGKLEMKINHMMPEYDIPFTIEFEHVKKGTEDIYKKTKTCIRKLLARTTSNDISEIILIGGSTKNRYLQELLNNDYGFKYEIKDTMEPDLSVSLGAAIKTAISMGSSNINISDVAPYTISLGVSNKDEETGKLIAGRVDQIIRKNTRLPATVAKSYNLTSKDSDIPLVFYTGESNRADMCVKIAEYMLVKKDTSMDFDLLATIDTNGVLSLKIKSGKDELQINLDGTLKSMDSTNLFSEKTTLVENKLVKRWYSSYKDKGISVELQQLFKDFLEGGKNTRDVFNQISEAVKRLKVGE